MFAPSDYLHQLGSLSLTPRWIPSHLDDAKLEYGFEDWVRHWNNRIDQMVGMHNTCRPSAFQDVYAQATQHHDQQAKKLRQLRSFFLKVAADKRVSPLPTESTEPELSPFDFPESSMEQPCLQDLYIDDVHSRVHDSGWAHQGVPLSFVELLFRWMLEHSGDEYPVYPLSFVELVFLYDDTEPAQYPFWNPISQSF